MKGEWGEWSQCLHYDWESQSTPSTVQKQSRLYKCLNLNTNKWNKIKWNNAGLNTFYSLFVSFFNFNTIKSYIMNGKI